MAESLRLHLQGNPQDALLKLLNRSLSSSKPEAVASPVQQAPEVVADDLSNDMADAAQENISPKISRDDASNAGASRRPKSPSPVRVFGSRESREVTPFEPPPMATPQEEHISAPAPSKPIFTYVNPFDNLQAAASREQSRSGRATPTAESSKRHRGPNGDAIKRESAEPSPDFAQTSSRRKQSRREPQPTSRKETVAEALEDVADTADKQADAALAKAKQAEDEATGHIKKESRDSKVDIDALADRLQDSAINAAVEMKQELDKKENDGVLDEELSKPVADAVRTIINDAAAEAGVADSWESAEGEDADRVVPVYNFPIKPFVSITLKDMPPSKVGLRDDGLLEISRLKKDFDQVDRSLAAASSKYIVYALVKNGGMRVIRQDDGDDRQIFKHTRDRVFNVTMCTTALNNPPSDDQAILGTGVSGATYWATISKSGSDLFEQDALESESLVFPPFPPGDENTSGGQLKTRAKRSSRHPEFFAIGRGKSIHIVWPATALDNRYGVSGNSRKVDVEKYFQDRTLKVATGKTGKDFCFSEDDSLICSLDKAGRLRFWDIRPLVEGPNPTAPKVVPVEIRTPLMTLATASPTEKSWPTSVLFIDKLRPYTKGIALRYVLVGLKQNHTLQLWDISLGKAVQEINFPHEAETDAICSVAYHPHTGIIVVGHPTRNSIYFIHLSAPRFNLPTMSQARYIELLAEKDQALPRPESTACMSGIREISFASKGTLRSLELLPVRKSEIPERSSDPDPEDRPVQFELYIVHSKGVTCLNIKKEDLGWSEDNKIQHPVNALEEGFIELSDLRLGEVIYDEDLNGEDTTPAPTPSKKPSTKTASGGSSGAPDASTLRDAPERNLTKVSDDKSTEPVNAEQAEAPTKAEKKKKKKSVTSDTPSKSATTNGALPKPSPSAQRQLSPQPISSSATNDRSSTTQPGDMALSAPAVSANQAIAPEAANTPEIRMGISGDFLDKELRKIEKMVSLEFTKVIGQELDSLYRRFDEDRRVQDAAGVAKQDAMLRMISSTLSDNVEKNLARIIATNVQQLVIPQIANVTATTLNSRLSETLAHHLHQSIPREMNVKLPAAINHAMQTPEVLNAISDLVSRKVAGQVERELNEALHKTITPTFTKLAQSTAEKTSSEVERRLAAQLKQAEAQSRADSAKIDALSKLMQGMSETISTMAEAQASFQTEIVKLNRRLAHRDTSSTTSTMPSSTQPEASAMYHSAAAQPEEAQKSAEDIEREELMQLMADGDYENASLRVRCFLNAR